MTARKSLKELVEGALQDAPDALKMLREQYRPRLAGLVDRLFPPPLDARGGVKAVLKAVDDLVPERLAGFQWEGDDHFDSWLVRLAKEQIIVLLLEMYRPRTLNTIRRSLPDYLRREGAEEDIWQEASIVALRCSDRFQWRSEGEFLSWFMTIATHQIEDRDKYEKAGKRDRARRLPNYPDSDRKSPGPGRVEQNAVDHDRPSKKVRRAERVRIMLDMMADILNEREQTALRLRHLEFQSVEGTSEIMGISESGVKMACKRAMDKIRRQLGDSFNATSSG
ncbi:RNA polymerase sigma factor [Planctomycetota bacterium]